MPAYLAWQINYTAKLNTAMLMLLCYMPLCALLADILLN